MPVGLRDYQADAVQRAREAIRAGAKNVLICAPTGAGKTQIASHLIEECRNKSKRANFVVDRLSLVNQTSAVFDGHGIDHRIIEAFDEVREGNVLPVRRPTLERLAVALNAQNLAALRQVFESCQAAFLHGRRGCRRLGGFACGC